MDAAHDEYFDDAKEHYRNANQAEQETARESGNSFVEFLKSVGAQALAAAIMALITNYGWPWVKSQLGI